MKKLVILFLTLATASVGSLRAQAVADCVVVETTGGERMEYLLSDLPRITQSADAVTLTTSNTSVELSAESISKVYLATSSPTTVLKVKGPAGSAQLKESQLFLSGYQPGERVSLFHADGRLLQHRSIGDDGTLTLSLEQLPSGIYIVKTNHQSIKIIKK